MNNSFSKIKQARGWLAALLFLLGLMSFSTAQEKAVVGELAYFDRAVFLEIPDKGGPGRSFTGLVIEKDEELYLVTCKHCVEKSRQKILLSVPGSPYQPRRLRGEWTLHPKADLALMKGPVLDDKQADSQLKKVAISFDQLQGIPKKLTRVVISGYPTRLGVKPTVSPIVRTAEVSSLEIQSKSRDGGSIPVYVVSEFSGQGASGSPVFIYSDLKKKSAACVGILAGGWNYDRVSGSVVTPMKYLKELFDDE